MRNFNKYILASTLGLGALFTSCEEEVLVPVEDNTGVAELLEGINTLENQLYEYNLEKRTVTIKNEKLDNTMDSLYDVWSDLKYNNYNRQTEVQYTVNVISAGNYVQGRVAGIGGATVTVRQGAYMETKETEGGLALFSGLKPGAATVTVSAPEHGSVEMNVNFLSDGTYSEDADYYNAATKVLLFPVAGKNAATIKGSLYANTTTVNDTLNRVYGYSSVYGDKAGKYVAKQGVYTGSNYSTMENYNSYNEEWYYQGKVHNPYYYNQNNLRSSAPEGMAIEFEKVPASFKLYAVAMPSIAHQFDKSSYDEDYTAPNAGYITSITYNDMVFEATVSNDNTYSVVVPASMGDNLSVQFQTTEVIADFTRFTVREEYWNGPGSSNELGSVKTTFKYYNSTDNQVTRYSEEEDGTSVGYIIEPNESKELVRRIITEPYRYELMSGSSSNNLEPGQVEFNNLYLFPVSRTNQSEI